MKQLIVFTFLLPFILLSACGPVTPTAVLSPIKTPSSTVAPAIPTPHPTSQIPSWLNAQPPSAAAASYKLRKWSDADYQEFLRQAVKLGPKQNNGFATILYQWILQNPASPEWQKGPWNRTIGDSVKISFDKGAVAQSPFARVFEKQVNAVRGDTTQIISWLESYGFTVRDHFSVKNLFGPGKDGTTFFITGDSFWGEKTTYTTVVALRPSDHGYRLETVADWKVEPAGGINVQTISDFNQNGMSEIAEIFDDHSPTEDICNPLLSVFEWDGQTFVQLVYHVDLFFGHRGVDDCDHYVWRFEPVGAGLPARLVTHDTQSTFSKCAALQYQHTYELNDDGVYQWSKTEISLPAEPQSLTCQVIWATYAMPEQDNAIPVLEAALKNWDDEAVQTFGPAGHDYFTLRLALWLVDRHNETEALKYLRSLSKKDSTDSTLPTRLAVTYLKGREALHEIGGCYLMNHTWYEYQSHDSAVFYPSDLELETRIKKQVEAFGFGDPVASENGIELCDLDDRTAPILTGIPATENSLKARLGKLADVVRIRTTDLNHDGRMDFAALLRENDSYLSFRYPLFWVFLNLPQGLKWQEIWVFGSGLGPDGFAFEDFDWQSVQLDQKTPAMIVQVSSALFVFQVDKDKLDVLGNKFGVEAYQFDPQTNDILLTWRESQEVWHWLSDAKRYEDPYDASNSQFIDQIERMEKVEVLIFQQQDFPTAVTLIKDTLSSFDASTDYEKDQINYLTYLLGLAYEMDQQPEKAAEAYYRVWQAMPDSPLGMAASAKLELKVP